MQARNIRLRQHLAARPVPQHSHQMRRSVAAAFVAGLLLAATTQAGAVASGRATSFRSPNGIDEQCIVLDHMPGGVYDADDTAQEEAFCTIDFYAGTHALCPKVFSTSPGTLIYDISRGPYAGDPGSFESEQCARSGSAKRGALGEPISFKTTMNDAHTSATFSTAALLYYHFSRYLDADVYVPVSVYRSMDSGEHLARVTRRGLELSASRKSSAMNHAGWRSMQQAETAPSSYPSTNELFTRDGRQIYGVMLYVHGDRYSAEVNGTRKSGWGAGQNRDFQQTAPFRALRSEQSLTAAIEAGVHEAAADSTLRAAMRHGVSPEQMVFWMQELTEITLLDYIFSQQDRIGNIDYLGYWYWDDGGTIKRRPASSTRVPDDIAAHRPVYLRRTQLNDNDAGGRVPYANFTKKTGMLEKIRHYRAETYRRLQRLDDEFADEGPLYNYVRDTFGLSDAQFRQLVANTRSAAALLRETCGAGKLRFDLEPHDFLLTGKAVEQAIDCDAP